MEEFNMLTSSIYSQAFWNVVRNPNAISDDLNSGRNSETGSYFFPDKTQDIFQNELAKENIFRRYGTFKEATTRDSTLWIPNTNSNVDWIGDFGKIPEVEYSADSLAIESHKLATITTIKNDILKDERFNYREHLVSEFSRLFGQAEENAFVNGDGDNKPIGILDDTNGAEVGEEVLADDISFENVSNLFFSLDKDYRKNAIWLMNGGTHKYLYFLKDSKGAYLWRESPDLLMGKPVLISNHMPSSIKGLKPIAFGNFKYYWVIQRQALSVKTLIEKYLLNDETAFIGFERIDGRLIRPEAIKTIKMA